MSFNRQRILRAFLASSGCFAISACAGIAPGTCRKCASVCPPKAIPFGEADGAFDNQSDFVGISKWNMDGEKCFDFWANLGTECGIRICPYNKLPATTLGRIYFRLRKWLAGSPQRCFALWLDNALGHGKRFRPDWWWQDHPGW